MPLQPLSLSHLCSQSQQLWEGERVRGTTPTGQKRGWDLLKVTKPVFLFPLTLGNSYTTYKTLLSYHYLPEAFFDCPHTASASSVLG